MSRHAAYRCARGYEEAKKKETAAQTADEKAKWAKLAQTWKSRWRAAAQ